MPDAKRNWTLKEIFTVALSLAPLVLLLDYLGKRPASGPAALFAMMIVIAVRWRWDLSDQRWFWGVVVTIIALHTALIWDIPWGSEWTPAALATPFCIVDVFVILGIFNFCERHFQPH